MQGLEWLINHRLPLLPDDDLYEVGGWVEDAVGQEFDECRNELPQSIREVIEDAVLRKQTNARPTALRPNPSLSVMETIDRVFKGGVLFDIVKAAKAASESELIEVAERLLPAQTSIEARSCGKAFSRQPIPLPAGRLIRRLEDPEVQHWYLQILERLDHPEVHDFAPVWAARRPIDGIQLSLFRSTFQITDEAIVDEVLADFHGADLDDQHCIVLDLLKITCKPIDVRRTKWLKWIYEHSPCSLCRSNAGGGLFRMGEFPPEWMDEVLFDAETELRELRLNRA